MIIGHHYKSSVLQPGLNSTGTVYSTMCACDAMLSQNHVLWCRLFTGTEENVKRCNQDCECADVSSPVYIQTASSIYLK